MLDNTSVSNYGKQEYWEDRYNHRPEPFDWYQVFEGIKDVICLNIDKKDRILNLGCGNSRLAEEMSEEGYEDIINIDL